MMKVSPFRKMTLPALLLPFYKVHLNLLKYEMKPPDKTINSKQADSAGKAGGPLSR